MLKKNLFKYKSIITYLLIYIADIVLVIFCAINNKVHYVKFMSKDVLVGNTHDLLFGRNYVNLVIICFFYLYLVVVNKFYLKKNNHRKFMIIGLVSLLFINIMLFYIFTKRIY